jgi:hypothetical protein
MEFTNLKFADGGYFTVYLACQSIICKLKLWGIWSSCQGLNHHPISYPCLNLYITSFSSTDWNYHMHADFIAVLFTTILQGIHVGWAKPKDFFQSSTVFLSQNFKFACILYTNQQKCKELVLKIHQFIVKQYFIILFSYVLNSTSRNSS